jgi:DNA-binding transcriptional LysR family regulator
VWIAAENFDVSKRPLPLVLFQTDCKYHAAAVDSLAKRSVGPQLIACCNTASAQRSLVSAGLGVGAMGQLSVNKDVVILDNMPPLPNVDIVLLTGASAHPLLTQLFIAEI